MENIKLKQGQCMNYSLNCMGLTEGKKGSEEELLRACEKAFQPGKREKNLQ